MGALLGFMLGFVLGAKAGPERFDELRRAWQTIVNSDEFQGIVGAGTAFVQSKIQDGQASINEALSGLLSGKGDLANSFKGFSGNGALMDAWETLSNSPEIQKLLAGGAAMLAGFLIKERASMRE